MPNRRKHKRWDVNLPVICKIRNRNQEIIISTHGKVKNICLGGMKIQLPIHLVLLKSRPIEYTVELPEPFAPLSGQGLIRWGSCQDTIDGTQFGLELYPLEGDQLTSLESILSELAQDQRPYFLTTLNN